MTRFLMFAVLVALVCPAAVRADDAPYANAVLAKAGSEPVVLWDASKVVAAMLRDGKSDESVLREVQADALLAAIDRAPKLKNAKTITVRVIYARSGEVSPLYKATTYSGFEKLLDVVVSPDIAEYGSERTAALRAGKPAAGVSIVMSGKLPPR